MALSRQQIEREWVAQGGSPRQAPLMAAIALRESGGRPQINNRGTNRNGTVDWGLYQVNDIWRKDPVVGPLFRSGAILTPAGSTRAALHILKVQGPRAWATYNPAIDSKYLSGLQGAPTSARKAAPVAQPGFDQQGFDKATVRAQILTQLLSHGNPNTDNPLVRFGLLQPDRASFQVGQPKPSAPAVKTPVRAPTGSAKGLFRVTGANPGRLKPPLIAFAERVASVYGQPITGDSGATHSRLTVDGNVSQHWTGNATDIPATGKRLVTLGRAALVAAGMPPAQAAKQTGGLFNFADGVQVIFNTMQGGNHYTHLHISHG